MAERQNPNTAPGRQVIRAPGQLDAGSGNLLLARSLDDLGKTFLGAAQVTGREVRRQVTKQETARGQALGRVAGAAESTRLPDGTLVPIASLSDETTIFSAAYNKAVLDTADNRFAVALRENLGRIGRDHFADPVAFENAARTFYDGLRQGIPEPSQAKFDNRFSALLTIEVESQATAQVQQVGDAHRGSNVRAIEELEAGVDRVGRDLTSPNGALGEAAAMSVLEARDDLLRMLDQTGPTGIPLYTDVRKETFLVEFDRRVERAGVLGAFDRAIDKPDFIERWVEGQKKTRVKSVLDLDQVESIAADMRAQLRREASQDAAALKQTRAAARDVLSVLQAGSEAAQFPVVRDNLLALGDLDTVEQLDNAKADLAFMGQFAQMAPSGQQLNIDLLETKAAGPGLTLREQLRFDAMRRQRALQAKALEADALGYAEAVGAIGAISPLNEFSEQQIRARDRQVDEVSAQFETEVGFFREAEVSAISEAFETATPEQVLQTFDALDVLSPDRQMQIASEIAPKRPELAAAISLSQDLPGVAREIVLGGPLLRANPDVRPGKDERLAAIDTVIGDLFTPETSAAQAGFVQAASSLYAARRVPGGDLTYDEDLFEQALADVMGRPVEFNGRKILPPRPDLSEDETEDLVGGLSDGDLVSFGNGAPVFADGSAFTVALFDRGIFSTNAELVTSGLGRYMIRLEGLGFILADGGQAYEIDLRGLLDAAADATAAEIEPLP